MKTNIRLEKNGDLTEEVRVKDVSLMDLQEAGWDAGDNSRSEREHYARFATKRIFLNLTRKQRQILRLMNEGRTREEIAATLYVSRQSVNQIVPRIRKRLRKSGIGYDKNTRRGGGQRSHSYHTT